MPRRQFTLSEEQERILHSEFLQCTDGPTQIRYQAVLLYGRGYNLENVIEITGCSRSSLMDWCRGYRKHGVEGLIDRRGKGNHSKLTAEQIKTLRGQLQHGTPAEVLGNEAGTHWTVDALKTLVDRNYGVVYKRPASYHRLFKKCGFGYERASQIYKPIHEQSYRVRQRVDKKRWNVPEIVHFRKSR